MKSLPFAPEGFPTEGRAASVASASERAAAHRRPLANASAFADIVSSLAQPPDGKGAAHPKPDGDANAETPLRPMSAGNLAPDLSALAALENMTTVATAAVAGRATAEQVGSEVSHPPPAIAVSAPPLALVPSQVSEPIPSPVSEPTPEQAPGPQGAGQQHPSRQVDLPQIEPFAQPERSPPAVATDKERGDHAISDANPDVAHNPASAADSATPVPIGVASALPAAPASPSATPDAGITPPREATVLPAPALVTDVARTPTLPTRPAELPPAATTLDAIATPAPQDATAPLLARKETATAESSPAVASLVGRVAVHVRDMQTHFAPVTARPVVLPDEPAPSAPPAPSVPSTSTAASVPGAVLGPAAVVQLQLAKVAKVATSSVFDAPAPSGSAPDVAPQHIEPKTAGGRESPGPDHATLRRPEVASTTVQEKRAEAGEETRSDVRPGSAATESGGSTTPAASSQNSSVGDPSMRTLALEIGRTARSVFGGSPALPVTDSAPTTPMALRRDVEVELVSPEFGVVRMRMRLTGSSLELRLRTDDPAMLTLLAERRTDLEKSIAETGVDAKVVDVSRTSTPFSASTTANAGGQFSSGDNGRNPDGQRFDQHSSSERDDRRQQQDRPTDGWTTDEDPPARTSTAGTLFV